jgi:hypothetical protein
MRALVVLLFTAALAGFSIVGAQSVHACPEGTVFSAYKGNGICAYIGQGAKVAVQCQIAKGKCPSGTTRERKKSDKNAYCCPEKIANEQSKKCVWRGEAPLCEGKCLYGEQSKGSARDKDGAYFNKSTKPWSSSFGKDCVGGSKELCCHYTG